MTQSNSKATLRREDSAHGDEQARKEKDMSTQVEVKEREASLVEDAASIRVMGFPVLEALPSPGASPSPAHASANRSAWRSPI